jgi:transcriptional regulator with XRE-family HTH domain
MKIDGGKCIREAIKLRGKTATQVARDLGMLRQAFDRWKYSSDIRLSKAQMLADYFELHIFDFLKLGEIDE